MTKRKEPILAWHFLPLDGRLTNGDGRRVRPGHMVIHRGSKLKLCHHGLHASRNILNALENAPGPLICRVECSGIIVEATDKLVCSRRKALWMFDSTIVLHEFSCWSAEQILHLCGDDGRFRTAIAAKRAWLRGEISNEELTVFEPAAWDIAEAAASAAASAAARAAANAAARAAAWAAANAAASATAWAAAWATAWAAQESKLIEMIEAARKSMKAEPRTPHA